MKKKKNRKPNMEKKNGEWYMEVGGGVGVNLEGVHLEEVSPSLEQSPSGFSEHPFKRITN